MYVIVLIEKLTCKRTLILNWILHLWVQWLSHCYYTFLPPLQAHRKHAEFLNKKINMYDELAIVVGKDTATWGFSKSYVDLEHEPHNTDKSAEYVADNVEEDVVEKGKNTVESSPNWVGNFQVPQKKAFSF